MDTYRVNLTTSLSLPDDRLTHLSWATARHGQGWRLRMDYHERHMAEPLAEDLWEFFRHLSYGALVMAPERAQEKPDWAMWWERVPAEHMPLRTFEMIQGRSESGQDYYVCQVRADMISAELIREINDGIPEYAGILRYRTAEPVAQAQAPDPYDVLGLMTA